MTANKIILEIGRVHRNPAHPWKQQFIINIRNSVDDIKSYPNNNSEDIKNYKEAEELDVILKNIRTYLLTRSPHEHIDVDIIMEG